MNCHLHLTNLFFLIIKFQVSPYINRFVQPDSIIPDQTNPQSWNRYAYVLNNPIRYNDPTGHVSCQGENWDDGPQCVGKPGWEEKATENLRTTLKEKYDWDVAEDFTFKELQVLYQTGRDIEEYVDDLTDGTGQEWMLQAFDNTTIVHGYHSDGHSDAFPFFGKGFGPRIRLDQNWLTHWWTPKVVFAHELGHVWDINTGFAASYHLNRDLGSSGVWLFGAPGSDVPQWRLEYHGGYGNGGRNEYFAEAFSATIYNRGNAPNRVSAWIDDKTSVPLGVYPWGRP